MLLVYIWNKIHLHDQYCFSLESRKGFKVIDFVICLGEFKSFLKYSSEPRGNRSPHHVVDNVQYSALKRARFLKVFL